MEPHLDTHIRAANGRIEKLEAEVLRLGRDLARAVEGRQADQERMHQDLEATARAVSARLAVVDEVRASLEGVSGVLRVLQAADREREVRLEELARGVERASARLESFESRIAEARTPGEQASGQVAAIRTELGRTADVVRELRDAQAQHAEVAVAELAYLRESLEDPVRRLARLEELRRGDDAAHDGIRATLGELAAADGNLRAAVERLNRTHGEAGVALREDVARLRAELERSVEALRQLGDERVARQQGGIDDALALAGRSRADVESLAEGYARLRAQLEGALSEQAVAETKRLERALEQARTELRAHGERRVMSSE